MYIVAMCIWGRTKIQEFDSIETAKAWIAEEQAKAKNDYPNTTFAPLIWKGERFRG